MPARSLLVSHWAVDFRARRCHHQGRGERDEDRAENWAPQAAAVHRGLIAKGGDYARPSVWAAVRYCGMESNEPTSAALSPMETCVGPSRRIGFGRC